MKKEHHKYLKNLETDDLFDEFEKELQKLEKKMNIRIYARLDSTTDGIIPVLHYDKIT